MMASQLAEISIEQVNFRFTITEIGKLNKSIGSVWSPEVFVNGATWRVYARKYMSRSEPWLALYLYCGKSEGTSNWSQVASATLELLPFKSGCTTIKRETYPFVFDYWNVRNGYNKFIRWADLFDEKNGYVKDDTVNFQIEIQAKTSNANVNSFESISRSCDQGCSSKFRMTVSNIESLSNLKAPEIVLQKVPCSLGVFKYSNNLGIALYSDLNDSFSSDTKFTVTLTAELISSHVSGKRCEKVRKTIDQSRQDVCIWNLISWHELLDPTNGFIKDGTISVELTIRTELLQGGLISNVNKRKATTDDHQRTAKRLKLECRICEKEIIDQDVSSIPCGHVFCSACIFESIKVRKACPSCDLRVTQNGVRRILLPKMD